MCTAAGITWFPHSDAKLKYKARMPDKFQDLLHEPQYGEVRNMKRIRPQSLPLPGLSFFKLSMLGMLIEQIVLQDLILLTSAALHG